MIHLFNRILLWLVVKDFFTAALKEGHLHLHRDPIRGKEPRKNSAIQMVDRAIEKIKEA